MATPKQRGTAFEHRVRKELEDAGYLVVRKPASLSPFDLLALRLERGGGLLPVMPGVFLIQCKLNGYISPGEREELRTLARRFGCQPVVAYTMKLRGEVHYRGWLGDKVVAVNDMLDGRWSRFQSA